MFFPYVKLRMSGSFSIAGNYDKQRSWYFFVHFALILKF